MRGYSGPASPPHLDTEWKLEAACRGMDPNLFFPTPGGSPPTQAYEACLSCPVSSECLEYALTVHSRHSDVGIWGGTSATVRRTLRRNR